MAGKHTMHGDTFRQPLCPRPKPGDTVRARREAKKSRPDRVPSFPTERAWLERRSRVKGEPGMARPWNKLTSRGTVRSSLHGIHRSPGEIC
ncbi:hypothetical protein NDU88_008295 [Pleurodeles waltl]|uniref:Uncharacterized protein n=1 Tax=Pleurodeles waltl TaxID=8319 RepID=A0AAV7QRD2_PLEWA|nr:hypothetical protein NDU88_008295 [Pleurodeles waltl]